MVDVALRVLRYDRRTHGENFIEYIVEYNVP